MDPVTVRRYRPTDAAAVWDVHVRDLSTAMPVFSTEWATDLHDVERAYLRDGEFLVAVANATVVGTGGFLPEDDETAALKRLRVVPERLGTGVFDTVVAELERLARSRGYDQAVLDSNGYLTTRNDALEAMGYELVDRGRLPEWDTDVLDYRKWL